MCIDENKFCDGVVDCRDGSDEHACDKAAGFTVPIINIITTGKENVFNKTVTKFSLYTMC